MEIERKFLVENLPDLQGYESKIMEQIYIGKDPEIRIRKTVNDRKEKYELTIKSLGDIERQEVEINIDKEVYARIKQITNKYIISKTRYNIPDGKYVYELDVYDNIKGLKTVEVEFDNLGEAENFIVPKWFGEEVTYNKEYKNKNLALGKNENYV